MIKFIKPNYSICRIPNVDDEYSVFSYLKTIGEECCANNEMNKHEYIQYISEDFNKHHHILGHLICVFSVSKEIYDDIIKYKINNKCNNRSTDWNIMHYLKQINVTYWDKPNNDHLKYIVSGSLETFINIWKCETTGFDNSNGFIKLCHWLAISYPEIMKNRYNQHLIAHEDIQYVSKATMEMLPKKIRMIHEQMTVMLTVDSGTANYIMNHRSPLSTASIAENKNSDKCGCNFIMPEWFNDHDRDALTNNDCIKETIKDSENNNPHKLSPDARKWLFQHIKISEMYKKYIKDFKWDSKKARCILPHSVETNIILTMQLAEWVDFFQFHCVNDHNEQAKELITKLLQDVSKSKPAAFGPLKYLCEREV